MSELGAKSKLKIGQFGYSLDIISLDKHGPCYFEGVRYDVKAGTDIRKWAEVIVITLAPEPTVIETTGIFPLSYELTAGGFRTVAENFPLPVTTGTKAITYTTIEATASGNTEIIAPTKGKKIRVHYFAYSNEHSALATVGMRFGDSGDIKHTARLAADGGNFNANLIDACWDGAVDEALNANLAAAYAGGIYFTVGYTEE